MPFPIEKRWHTALKCPCCTYREVEALPHLRRVGNGPTQGKVQCQHCRWTYFTRAKAAVAIARRRLAFQRRINRGVGRRIQISEWLRPIRSRREAR